MLHSGEPGDEVESVFKTADRALLRLRNDTGEGRMTVYRVFDGVYLMYSDFHMAHCVSRFASTAQLFRVDHCREGHIEHRTAQGKRYYMEAGDLRVDRRVHHSGQVDLPLAHYHGLTLGFFLDEAERAVRQAMPAVSVGIAADVGYDDPSKFAAAFKAFFGVTPAAYRNDRR